LLGSKESGEGSAWFIRAGCLAGRAEGDPAGVEGPECTEPSDFTAGWDSSGDETDGFAGEGVSPVYLDIPISIIPINIVATARMMRGPKPVGARVEAAEADKGSAGCAGGVPSGDGEASG